jgi:UDP-N-acetylglucosamine 2-epimerase (non-hydrolysing)
MINLKSIPQIKILTVVGARPNFMKVAPIIRAIRDHNEKGNVPRIDHVLVHTGQHYDAVMSDSFFLDLGLPKPDVHLGIGSGSHAVQTAEIMKKFESVILGEKPDFMVVVGDVNSTLACALVTAKVSFDSAGTRPLIVHIESGLRSFDRSMPEEVNRIATDHLSDLLFITEESGFNNLRNEGIPANKIHFVGNTMIDSLLDSKEKAESSVVLEELGLRASATSRHEANGIRRYALLTLHRPSNVDNRQAFMNIVDGLHELAAECPIIFPVHPRTRQRIREFGLEFPSQEAATKNDVHATRSQNHGGGIVLSDPRGYLDFLCLMKHATIVVTDSGGIQEETTCLGIPCVTVRENTERPVTVESGTNLVAGTTKERILAAIRTQMHRSLPNCVPKFWDGRAAARIVQVLAQVRPEKENVESVRETLIPGPCA